MTGPLVVLDSGAVDQVVRSRRLRQRLAILVADGWDPVIPTVVLAEIVTGRATDAVVNRVVSSIGTIDTSVPVARQAGALRFAAGRRLGQVPSGIDALVAAHAAEGSRAVVCTSDPGDLSALLADVATVVVERV